MKLNKRVKLALRMNLNIKKILINNYQYINSKNHIMNKKINNKVFIIEQKNLKQEKLDSIVKIIV